ncbi:unnamed protein product [Tilletia laevis]|uniref:NAD(P)-binding protein n=2 Tax=Tilletia TaxID=13289 RepID=A0A177VAS7_9BASI|nr:hypothetical protein CF336_g1197 [Tilletia laevis]KAE8264600.1 hypothetical protein A4X03_0g828 [Tilletia caries]CAD6904588.1 unnamed protein product [Tilletia controversa]KAE8207463.1 hypothetical protein CF335_g1116 [Tilletia laevis]CAD6891152.1 unnamed protein product [Tilletia caries]
MVRTTKFSTSEIPDLTGKVAIVTGTSPGGIGAETARQLAIAGAKVYLAARNEEKNKKTLEEIQSKAPEGKTLKLELLKLDLADLAAVRQAADDFKAREERLDICVLNAGIMACPKDITKDGWEIQFQANYLGHFLFTKELLPVLEAGAAASGHPSRVISLSSIGHRAERLFPWASISFESREKVNRTFGPSVMGNFLRYSQAKLADLLFAREWNRRIGRPGGGKVMAASVHPGVIKSNLYIYTPGASLIGPTMLPTADGALSSLYVATNAELETEASWDVYRGDYGLQHTDSTTSKNVQLASDLWELSEDAVKDVTSATRTPKVPVA